MSDALRSLLAEFVVEVDRAGELAKGNEAITALKTRLTELQDSFKKVKAPAEQAARAVNDVFTRAAQTAQRNLQALAVADWGGRDNSNPFAAAGAAAKARLQGAQALGGRADNTGFGALSGLVAGIGPQLGPTRDTLNAGRAQMRAAEEAAAAYAQTLRGKLAGAVNAVRAGFNGGGGGGGGDKGPGLIASLATVRNGLLALGAGTAVAGVKRLVDGIGGIGEGAAKLGVTSAQFQRLRVLAAQSDTSVESLGGAFRNLANAAAQPSKGTAAAFAKLGVSTKDANGQLKSSNDLFWDVSRALAGVGNETERSALAQDLLGRGAQDLKAIFSSGADAVDRQRAALEKLGVLSDETIKSADEASDMWAGFGLTMLAAAEPILKVVLPALVDLTKLVSKGVEWVGKWLKQTDLASVAITALGAAMYLKVIPGLRLMVGLGGGASRVFLTMAGSVGKFALSLAKTLGPLLILEDFIVFLRGGKSVIGTMLDKVFGEGTASGTLKALSDMTEGFKDLWNWILGNGQGEKVRALYQEIADGIEIIFHDLLVSLGVRKGEKGPQGLEDYNAGKAGTGLGTVAKIAGGVDNSNWLVQDLAQRAAERRGEVTIPVPGGGSQAGRQGTTTIVNANGDRTVQITMGSSATAPDVGRETSTALERDRASIPAGTP